MKIISVGDIHGNIDIVNIAIEQLDECDKMVFIGDYADSFTKSNREIRKCLEKLILLKAENFDKVELLLGNHDIHYMYQPEYRCSGFRPEVAYDLQDLFITGYFSLSYFISGYLFTHAGVCNKWLDKCPFKKELALYGLEMVLIEALQTKKGKDWLFQAGGARGGMKYDVGGILWADKTELINDPYFDENIKVQVVGHTYVPNLEKVQITEDNLLYFIDCKTEFLTLNID